MSVGIISYTGDIMSFRSRNSITGRVVLLLVTAVFLFTGCTPKSRSASTGAPSTESRRIAVFVPGIVSGSPVYEMLSEGVMSCIGDWNAEHPTKKATVTVIEAGTNQAEWNGKLTALAASGSYDVIISSNPSLPELAAPLTRQFPDIKFILLDAELSGNPAIETVQYNQCEQAYLAGYAAGVATISTELTYANPEKKVALIAAQEYPVMNNVILTYFTKGVCDAAPGASVDFRVVGNWYDASKGAEIARALYNDGVDVILPIAGGAGQGVIAAAQELGFYITWFDDNGFAQAPGLVISSTVMEQKRMAYEVTKDYLEGNAAFGTARTVGVREGYVRFVQDDPLYISSLPEKDRARINAVYEDITNGNLVLGNTQL